jgi:hypothetical protein
VPNGQGLFIRVRSIIPILSVLKDLSQENVEAGFVWIVARTSLVGANRFVCLSADFLNLPKFQKSIRVRGSVRGKPTSLIG